MLSFQPNSEEWKQRKATSKWKDYPDYAKFKKGYIDFRITEVVWLFEI